MFHAVKGVYCGLCILSLLLVPSFASKFPSPYPIVPAYNVTLKVGLESYIQENTKMRFATNRPTMLVPLTSLLDIYNTMTKDTFNYNYGLPYGDTFVYNASRAREFVTYDETDVFRFIGWYSDVGMNVGLSMQLLSTVCTVGVLDSISTPLSQHFKPSPSNMHTTSLLRNERSAVGTSILPRILQSIMLAGILASFVSSLLITPIDFALQESQRQIGGKYGVQNWQYNQTALADPLVVEDMAALKKWNTWRGIGGVVMWVISIMLGFFGDDEDDEDQHGKVEYKTVPI